MLLMIVFLFFSGCLDREKEEERTVSVTGMRIRKEIVEEKIYAIGTVTYYAKASVTSKVMGEVEKVYADVGQVVRKGAPLIRLDTFPLELEMKKAKAELESSMASLHLSEAKLLEAEKRIEQQMKVIEKSEADLAEKQASLENLKKTVDRKKQLFEVGAVTQEELDNILTELNSSEIRVGLARKELEIQKNGYTDEDLLKAGFSVPETFERRLVLLKKMNTAMDRADLDMQKARIKNGQAGIESIQMLIDKSTVRAPISGIVAARNIEPGERVVNEEPLMILMNIEDVYAVMNVTVNDSGKVVKGNRVEVLADAVEGHDYKGIVTMVSPVVDLKTGIIEVKGLIPNPGYKLKPGMFIRGSIFTGKKHEAFRIPKSALITSQSNRGKVFVVMNSNEIYFRDVMYKTGNSDVLEIEKGLSTNDIILKDGSLQLNEGEKVHGLQIETFQ